MVKRALEILTDDAEREIPILSAKWPVFGAAAAGFGLMCILNVGTRRPVFSGIQYHFISAAVGAIVGHTIDGWRDAHMAERDAVLRHYVETHPDLFPDPVRQKYSEVLMPWVPIR